VPLVRRRQPRPRCAWRPPRQPAVREPWAENCTARHDFLWCVNEAMCRFASSLYRNLGAGMSQAGVGRQVSTVHTDVGRGRRSFVQLDGARDEAGGDDVLGRVEGDLKDVVVQEQVRRVPLVHVVLQRRLGGHGSGWGARRGEGRRRRSSASAPRRGLAPKAPPHTMVSVVQQASLLSPTGQAQPSLPRGDRPPRRPTSSASPRQSSAPANGGHVACLTRS